MYIVGLRLLSDNTLNVPLNGINHKKNIGGIIFCAEDIC